MLASLSSWLTFELIEIAAILTVAGFVKGVIGLGLPTISMALLGTFMSPSMAASVLVFPTFVTNIWQVTSGPHLRALAWRLWPMMACVVAGTLLTSGLIVTADRHITGTLLGTVLVAYAGIALAGRAFNVPAASEWWIGPVMGSVTGLINGSTGVFVVPGVPYLQALGLGKDGLVQAMAIGALVSSTALSVGLGAHGALGVSAVAQAAVALVASLIGMAVGQAVRHRLAPEAFRRAVLIGMMALGVLMIVRALA